MEQASDRAYFLPIACRFVQNDQWLVTHLNTSWKVAEVKHWFLAKLLPSVSSPVNLVLGSTRRPKSSQRRRAVSPIRFAPTDVKAYHDSDDGDDDEVSEDIYDDRYKYTHAARRSAVSNQRGASSTALSQSCPPAATSSQPSPVLTSSYVLLSFSTGQVLEDHYALSWYALHPYELVELHLASSITKLSRSPLEEYIQPYFEARVWALRTAVREVGGRLETPAKKLEKDLKSTEGEDKGEDASGRKEKAKKRRTKHEWRDRWVVVHQGLLKLCRERSDGLPTHISPLSSLLAIRGGEHLHGSTAAQKVHPSSLTSPTPSPNLGISPSGKVEKDKYIICLKFRTDLPDPTRSRTSTGESLGNHWFRRGSKDATAHGGDLRRHSRVGLLEDPEGETEGEDVPDKGKERERGIEDGLWIVMDMMEESAFQNILRVLHREAPPFVSSSFLGGERLYTHRHDGSSIGRSLTPISFVPPRSPLSSPLSSPISFRTVDSDSEPSSAESPSLPPSPAPSLQAEPLLPRYPEWRTNVVKRARKAGLGDVGRAMEWAMFGISDSDSEGTPVIPSRGRQEKRRMSEQGETVSSPTSYEAELASQVFERLSDVGSSEGDDGSVSEQEWEGWREDCGQRYQFPSRTRDDSVSDVQWCDQWGSSWGGSEDTHVDHSPLVSPPEPTADPAMLSPPMRPLSSYASADSLFKRTIKRHSPQKSHLDWSGSPARGAAWSRPLSPLSAQFEGIDNEDEGEELGAGSQSSHMSHLAYPHPGLSRPQHLEPGALSRPYDQQGPAARMPLPMSMTMSTITSTVSVGRKKEKDVFLRKQRKRASTVSMETSNPAASSGSMSTLSPRPSKLSKGKSDTGDGLRGARSKDDVDMLAERPLSSGAGVQQSGLFRPAKLKLSLSFAQVAAANSSALPLTSAMPDVPSNARFASPELE